MRKLLIGLVVLALVLGVFAGTALATWTEAGNQTIKVELEIASETWILYEDDSFNQAVSPEPDIEFGTTSGGYPADPYRPLGGGLIGIYLWNSTKAPTDAYAKGYYESEDGATIYLKSNRDLSGVVQCSGPLTNAASDTLPSWFTVAVNGYDEDLSAPEPNGFRLGNSGSTTGWVADGTFPLDSMGGYGGNGLSGGDEITTAITIMFGSQDFHPDQDAFKMMAASYPLDMDAPVGPGTMKFLGRVERNGMADVAGQYTATLWVDFSPA